MDEVKKKKYLETITNINYLLNKTKNAIINNEDLTQNIEEHLNIIYCWASFISPSDESEKKGEKDHG